MALTKDITINAYGKPLSFPSAYMRIIKLEGNKLEMLATVETYAEKEGAVLSRDAYEIKHDVSSNSNSFAQAYTYLKSLPEFAGAMDC